jgi:hypothetical protein
LLPATGNAFALPCQDKPQDLLSPTGQSNGFLESGSKTEKPAAMRRAFAFFVQ